MNDWATSHSRDRLALFHLAWWCVGHDLLQVLDLVLRLVVMVFRWTSWIRHASRWNDIQRKRRTGHYIWYSEREGKGNPVLRF